MYCYLLYTDQGHTYVGATLDPDHRLRQHNQEITGGARATAIRVAQGHTWKRACMITGIPDWRSALQIEWRWKQLGRTQCKHIHPSIPRRLHSLHLLLSKEKPTVTAIPYDMYPDGPPSIQWESETWKAYYETIGHKESE